MSEVGACLRTLQWEHALLLGIIVVTCCHMLSHVVTHSDSVPRIGGQKHARIIFDTAAASELQVTCACAVRNLWAKTLTPDTTMCNAVITLSGLRCHPDDPWILKRGYAQAVFTFLRCERAGKWVWLSKRAL